jgi:hypothetical protein
MTAIKNDIEKVRAALSGIRSRRAVLVSQLGELDAESQTLKTAPLTRDDFEAVLIRDVAAQQSNALADAELIAELEYLRSRNVQNQLAGDAGNMSPFMRQQYNQSIVDRLLAVSVAPRDIVKRLSPAIDTLDFSQSGPPLAERKARLAEIEKQRQAIQSELTEIEALLANADPNRMYAVAEPKVGERREINGRWATYSQLPNGVRAWDFDDHPWLEGQRVRP